MSLAVEILKQDLKVAKKYIDKDLYNFNVISNRIMSNLLVADDDEKILLMVGIILKEMAGELNSIKAFNDETKYSDGVHIAKTYLDKLSDIIATKEYGGNKLLEFYFEYENKILVHLTRPSEDIIYKKQTEFTRKFNLMIIQHFLDNKELLLQENNNLLKGLINEFSRVINLHGGKEADFVIYLVFKSFDKYYEYALYSEIGLNGRIGDKKSLQSKLTPYIENIEKMKQMVEDDEALDELYKLSTEMLCDLAIRYRKYFINYMDIYPVSVDIKKIKSQVEAVTEEPEIEAI